MTLHFTTEVIGLPKILRWLNAPADLIGPAMRTAMTTSVLLIQAEAMKLVPVDTGNLRRTITHKVAGGTIPLMGTVGTNAVYARAVHEGRRPGMRMPPPARLVSWIKRHGGNPNSAFVVARSIARRGITGRPFFTRAVANTRAAVRSAFDRMGKEIEAKWGSG